MAATKFPATMLFPPPPEDSRTLFGLSGYFTQLGNALTNFITKTFEAFRLADHSIENLVLPKTSGAGIKVDTAVPTFPWHDILGNLYIKTAGLGSPTLSVYMGGNVKQFSFANGDSLYMEFHIPHDYVPGTDLFIHVHWSHNGTAISGNVVFDCYSTYAKGHNQAIFPAEKNQNITVATTNVTTTPRYSHRLNEVQLSIAGGSATLLDTSNIEPDGVILTRFNTTTNPTITGGAPDNVFVHYVDIHYRSTGIGTKQNFPNFYV